MDDNIQKNKTNENIHHFDTENWLKSLQNSLPFCNTSSSDQDFLFNNCKIFKNPINEGGLSSSLVKSDHKTPANKTLVLYACTFTFVYSN